MPVVQITAVPNVAEMVGVFRILEGESVTCVVGDPSLSKEEEQHMRRRYMRRALEILEMTVSRPQIFTLDRTRQDMPFANEKTEG